MMIRNRIEWLRGLSVSYVASELPKGHQYVTSEMNFVNGGEVGDELPFRPLKQEVVVKTLVSEFSSFL